MTKFPGLLHTICSPPGIFLAVHATHNRSKGSKKAALCLRQIEHVVGELLDTWHTCLHNKFKGIDELICGLRALEREISSEVSQSVEGFYILESDGKTTDRRGSDERQTVVQTKVRARTNGIKGRRPKGSEGKQSRGRRCGLEAE